MLGTAVLLTGCAATTSGGVSCVTRHRARPSPSPQPWKSPPMPALSTSRARCRPWWTNPGRH
jgi:hypothetical protein